MIENTPSRFEPVIQRIVEDGIVGLFRGHVQHVDIAGRLLVVIAKKIIPKPTHKIISCKIL